MHFHFRESINAMALFHSLTRPWASMPKIAWVESWVGNGHWWQRLQDASNNLKYLQIQDSSGIY